MDAYLIVKTLHIVSSTILFGTGLGIAFFMVRSQFCENIVEKHYAARTTVLADTLFTLPAVIVQPVTGFWLILHGGYEWTEFWLVATYISYAIAGACWLPVVWLQIEMKNMLAAAVESDGVLPPRYFRLFKIWFALGWPAFIGLIAVFFMMVMKPV